MCRDIRATGPRDFYEHTWGMLPAGVRPSHLRRRLSFLRANVAAGERVLDVGCGDGTIAAELARAGAEVVGIDVSDSALERAAHMHPGIELLRVPASGPLPFAESAFDVVWAGEVIEHVLDTSAWLSEVRRVLRPRGRLVISTPNHPPLLTIGLALWPRAFAGHFDPRSDHLRFYSRSTLRALLADFGFEQVSLRTAIGPPGARRLLLAVAVRSRF